MSDDLTVIDTLYFATVTATTVGYGHMVWARSDSAKGCMIVYLFYSTVVVGRIIGDLSSLCVLKTRAHTHTYTPTHTHTYTSPRQP